MMKRFPILLLLTSALIIALGLPNLSTLKAENLPITPKPCLIAHFEKTMTADLPKDLSMVHCGGKIIYDGMSGNALNLAKGEYISFDSEKIIQPNEGTLMFWVRPHWGYYASENDNIPVSHTFVSFGWQDNGYFVLSDGWWEPVGAPHTFFIFNNKQHIHTSQKIMYTRDEWIHLACTWKNGFYGSVKLYKNAELIAEKKLWIRGSFNPEGPIYVGSDKGSNLDDGRSADSDVDEIMIFNKALSKEEILNVGKQQNVNYEKHLNGWADSVLSQPYNPLGDSHKTVFETRAIFDEGTGWMTEKGAKETIERIKKAGFNVYIPCVWHGRGTRYPADIAPADKRFDFSDHDPLSRIIKLAHQNDIEVHPWFTVALKQQAFFLKKYYSLRSPRNAFDLHRPEFREFIGSVILDVIKRYDVDGINLDFIRTMGFCTCFYCRNEYNHRYGRNLIADIHNIGNDGRLTPPLQEWQDQAVEEIVQMISVKGKALKPNLIISVDGHPKPQILPPSWEGRQEIKWANSGLVDLIFNMEYSQRPDFEKHELIRKELNSPSKLIMLLGNYEKGSDNTIQPRDAQILAKLIGYVQRKWPGGLGLYLCSQLDDHQTDTLAEGVFKNPAKPVWFGMITKN